MAFAHRLQSSRFELKYLIDEMKARAIRDFARSHLAPDKYAPATATGDYVVNSLYLDNHDLALCRATLTGQRNRFKLRIRLYDDNPANPVFFEIKRRDANVVLKRRAAVRREAVDRLLRTYSPRREDLMTYTPEGFGALERFCELAASIRAQGQTYVYYLREAYESSDSNAVRLTFDRHLQAAPFDGRLRIPAQRERFAPRVPGVVLELKFTNRFPKWMRQMVRIFDLDRCSFAKYVTCLQALHSQAAAFLRPFSQGVKA
ncbi:MAG: polyphosphate polymerase domain-containing protein [Planctomycetes bacterium]|nr:polyphosphate polymerase domain-containing protein [Planctomycetota bacterium]